jgi:hypothetical protein
MHKVDCVLEMKFFTYITECYNINFLSAEISQQRKTVKDIDIIDSILGVKVKQKGREGEREREREHVCVCVCACVRACGRIRYYISV